MKLTRSERGAVAGWLCTLGLALAVHALACATPAILIDNTPHPCGQYPVDCGGGKCCPEGEACVAGGLCEDVGPVVVSRDAGGER